MKTLEKIGTLLVYIFVQITVSELDKNIAEYESKKRRKH